MMKNMTKKKDSMDFFAGLTKEEMRVIEKELGQLVISFSDDEESKALMDKEAYIGMEKLGEYYYGKLDKYNSEKFLDMFIREYKSGSMDTLDNADEIYNRALFYKGCIYYNDAFGSVDYEKAFRCYKEASDVGNDPESQCNISCMYSYGQGVERNLKKAFEYAYKSAIQGNVYAQNSLGRSYEFGYGVEKDIKEAYKWYKLAADQGDDLASENLLRLQGNKQIPIMGSFKAPINGNEVEINNCIAEMDSEAAKGDWKMQCLQAGRYYHGILCEKDVNKAISLLTEYEKQGNIYAAHMLSVFYGAEESPIFDSKKSIDYLLLAANEGLVSAKYDLGLCYLKGRHIKKDTEESFAWFLSAALDGHPGAQFQLAYLYYHVKKDIPATILWDGFTI